MTFAEAADYIRQRTHYDYIEYDDGSFRIYDDYLQAKKLFVRLYVHSKKLNDVGIDWVAFGKSCPSNEEVVLVMNAFMSNTTVNLKSVHIVGAREWRK